jgi:hypothetical protein
MRRIKTKYGETQEGGYGVRKYAKKKPEIEADIELKYEYIFLGQMLITMLTLFSV